MNKPLAITERGLPRLRGYRAVADEIEALLPEIERAAEESALPDEPDLEWIDDFVARVYREQVLAG